MIRIPRYLRSLREFYTTGYPLTPKAAAHHMTAKASESHNLQGEFLFALMETLFWRGVEAAHSRFVIAIMACLTGQRLTEKCPLIRG